MDNIEKIVEKLLNDKYMTPAKIKAFSYVIQSLKGIPVASEANALKDVENDKEMTEDQPIDFTEVEGIQIDGQKVPGKIKIYKN